MTTLDAHDTNHPASWGAISLTVGFCVGFLWMATDNIISRESLMILFIFTATLIFYPILEVIRYYLKYNSGPSILTLSKIGVNDRDLAIKLMASVAGWMTGAYYAKQ